MDELSINIQLIHPDAEIPKYSRDGDCGIDLQTMMGFTIKPFERVKVPCGFSIAIPEGYAGLIVPRSGLAAKNGITVVNSPGLIDSNYRGQICVVLENLDSEDTYCALRGDRIAQLLIIEVPKIKFNLVEELDTTIRGSHAFGSSGK